MHELLKFNPLAGEENLSSAPYLRELCGSILPESTTQIQTREQTLGESISSGLKGVAHGTIDVVADHLMEGHSIFSYIGLGMMEDLTIEERMGLMKTISESETKMLSSLDVKVQLVLGATNDDEIYATWRTGTKTTIEVVEVVAGGVGVAKTGLSILAKGGEKLAMKAASSKIPTVAKAAPMIEDAAAKLLRVRSLEIEWFNARPKPSFGLVETLEKNGGAILKEHQRFLKEYGKVGYVELENGCIRYYDKISPARNSGEMIGRRRVKEFNLKTGETRFWHETLDNSGHIRQIRPQASSGEKKHYVFDKEGNYETSR